MEIQSTQTGKLLGSILLISGCCIGAGMLGLPVLSGYAGFVPASFIFAVCWLFMLTTGLLLLEVNLWTGKDSHIVTMAEQTLGYIGKAISWGLFLFLFYSLMVAYVTASGSLINDFIEQVSGIKLIPGVGSVLSCLLFGAIIYWGTQAVDWFNRLLMLGLIFSYTLLVVIGSKHVDVKLLQYVDWSQVTLVIPAAILSFGFHNLIPSLTNYLNGDVKALKYAFVIGSAIPLLIYLVWEWLILGIVPLTDFKAALDQGEIATQALRNAVGASWVTDVAEAFAFFAIITSLLGVALSFVDFLADGLSIKKTPSGKAALTLLVLVPPLIFALLYPTIFLVALSYAGGFGAVVLFGILPAVMVWKGRYYKNLSSKPLVWGGRFTLVVVIAFSLWVIGLQLV